jgi:hypothetical protein
MANPGAEQNRRSKGTNTYSARSLDFSFPIFTTACNGWYESNHVKLNFENGSVLASLVFGWCRSAQKLLKTTAPKIISDSYDFCSIGFYVCHLTNTNPYE